jgi:hypothetical protein
MSNLTEYFNRKEQPRTTFKYGDRVFGRTNKVPFIGTVQHEIDSLVMIHSDLPILIEGMISNIVTVKKSDITRLTEME